MPLLALRRRALRATFSAAVALTGTLAAGCGDVLSPNGSVVGTYELDTYQGEPVPLVVDEQRGVYRLEVLDGVVDLRDDRTFTADVRTRDTDLETGTATIEGDPVSGRYTVRGGTITFTNTTDVEFDGAQATVRGNTLTLRDPTGQVVLTFRR